MRDGFLGVSLDLWKWVILMIFGLSCFDEWVVIVSLDRGIGRCVCFVLLVSLGDFSNIIVVSGDVVRVGRAAGNGLAR